MSDTDPQQPCARCGQTHHRCAGHSKRHGGPCGRWPSHGGTVCATHGGSAPQVRAANTRRLAEQQAAATAALFATRRDINPADALLELVQWTAGEVDYWRTQVQALDRDELTWGVTKHETGQEKGQPTDLTTKEAGQHVAYRMLTDASDRLARYAAAALKAGVEERRVRLAEAQGGLVALAVRRILDALNLTPAQLELVPTVVPRELRAIAAPQEEA